MSDIDYDLLAGSRGGEPPDGIHVATLVRAALVETTNGSRLVTEWQTGGRTPYYWTAWHGFAANRIALTQDFLDGLGVDRATVTDDEEFDRALFEALHRDFTVRVEHNGSFLNTYVEGKPSAQMALSDAPVDTSDLPEPVAAAPPAARTSDDDDIPF